MRALAVLLAVALLALGGCKQSKEDILKKAETVKTRADLEASLGRPKKISKVGPVETWTYKGSNGRVTFLVVGDTVTLQATSENEGKKKDKKR